MQERYFSFVGTAKVSRIDSLPEVGTSEVFNVYHNVGRSGERNGLDIVVIDGSLFAVSYGTVNDSSGELEDYEFVYRVHEWINPVVYPGIDYSFRK